MPVDMANLVGSMAGAAKENRCPDPCQYSILCHYSYCWFGPVQDVIGFLYNHLQEITRAANDRQVPYLDRGNEFSYINYQLLKHAFRLSWFYLAAYFYNYRAEEKKRTERQKEREKRDEIID